MMSVGGPPVEGFAVETRGGLIFTVKGLVHPPERVVAYLRYAPDADGDRERDGRRYRRIYGFREQEERLEATAGYLVDDPVFGTRVQGVPRRDVSRVYDPCHRTAELLSVAAPDPLEALTVSLVRLLCREAGVAATSIGITGSLLLRLHRAESDIDLVVYGQGESRAVRAALARLVDDPGSSVQRPSPAGLVAIYQQHRSETPLSWSDFSRLQRRKVNEGRFADRSFFVRFVKRPSESAESYGDPRVEPGGPASLVALVVDDSEALFTPCRYRLREAIVTDGAPAPDIREVVSFRGRFAEQASAGDRVRARGRLELVIPRRGSAFHRLIVGSQSGDYLTSDAE